MTIDRRLIERLEGIRERPLDLPPLRKKMLLIRPTVTGDRFTEDSYVWAELVREKAVTEGWEVEDLSGRDATRNNIEDALSVIAIERPVLVFHYDHGSEFTLHGHSIDRRDLDIDDFAPALDDHNIDVAAGTFVSAMACLSASGLGPLAIYERVSGYLGYAEALWGSISHPDRFGEAVNAPNYALLEGKTPEEAYEIGYQAWERVRQEELEEARTRDGLFAYASMAAAQINRDGLTLLLP